MPPFAVGLLAKKGSLYLTRTSLFTYTTKREDLDLSSKKLFQAVKNGVIKVEINQTYSLKDAAQAHRDLESRKTTGSTLLLPV